MLVTRGSGAWRLRLRGLSGGSAWRLRLRGLSGGSAAMQDPELAELIPRISRLDVKRLPARTRELLHRIVRVDHAGELGADRIYAGQYAVLHSSPAGPLIRHMREQEQTHLATFEALVPALRVRPTALAPLWHAAGFLLGAGTAALGTKAAMACTVAVEAEIQQHYDAQIRELLADDPQLHADLLRVISRFRDEEGEHHDTGIREDAESAPAYDLLYSVIRAGCKAAIFLSERI